MNFSDIIKYADGYGLGGVIILSIISMIIALSKLEWFAKLVTNLVSKKPKSKNVETSKKTIRETDIVNHDIIRFIDFWLYSKVPTFQFSTEYRTAVFRKYIEIYLNGYKKNITSFINSGKFKTMDDAEIWKCSLGLINNTIYDYESEMRKDGIPETIIEKMKVKNNDTLSLTIDLIEGICNSNFYSSDNNLLKAYSILNILLSILENTISHSESVCDSINGELKGFKYKGFKEP
jgi:hypothetical protein|tara:strand:- start:45292 stop:45993 length:702 start_codon:yes stop_codon:yes gene_type:complete